MFGSIETMVQKGKWEKVAKKLEKANAPTRLAAAKACGSTSCDESFNILVALVKDEDEAVQVEAINSMGKTANDRGISTLSWLLEHTPDSKASVKNAIHTALNAIKSRKN